MTDPVTWADQVLKPFWKDFTAGRSRLNPDLVQVLLAWAYAALIGNGGHWSWIENKPDIPAQEVVAALRRVGADAQADIAQDALGASGGHDSVAIAALDERSFALGMPEVVWEACSAFLAQHPEALKPNR